jgi:hypothetical protein
MEFMENMEVRRRVLEGVREEIRHRREEAM